MKKSEIGILVFNIGRHILCIPLAAFGYLAIMVFVGHTTPTNWQIFNIIIFFGTISSIVLIFTGFFISTFSEKRVDV